MIRRPRILVLLFLTLLSLAHCGASYSNVANLASSGATIVCFGDSITRGYGASPGHDYPAILARIVGHPVVNAGRDGDTTETALARLDRDVLSLAPRLVIVGLGGNDFLRQTPKATTVANLDRIVSRIVASGAMVVVVHAKFGLFDDPYRDDFEAIAVRHGGVIVTDVLKDVLGRPSRMYDQIHPNDAGYALIAERVGAIVKPLLDAADAARAKEVSSGTT